jgi:dienelactone hydrolase
LIGGRDAVVGRKPIERTLSRLTRDGVSVRSLLLEEAEHGFDEADAGAWRGRFRPDLAEAARALYVEALTESLAAP